MTKITILFIICFKNYLLFTPNCKHAIISGMSSGHEEHLYKLEEKHGGGSPDYCVACYNDEKIKVFDT